MFQEPSVEAVQHLLISLIEDENPVSKQPAKLVIFAAALLQHASFTEMKDPDKFVDKFVTFFFIFDTLCRFQKMLTQVKFAFLCESISLNAPQNRHTSSHNSHLSPHTSHLTPHTPHTSHTSHLTSHTPHTSHLTPPTPHLPLHSSHLTPHTSHLTYGTFRRGIHEVQNQYQHNRRQAMGATISGFIRYKF